MLFKHNVQIANSSRTLVLSPLPWPLRLPLDLCHAIICTAHFALWEISILQIFLKNAECIPGGLCSFFFFFDSGLPLLFCDWASSDFAIPSTFRQLETIPSLPSSPGMKVPINPSSLCINNV